MGFFAVEKLDGVEDGTGMALTLDSFICLGSGLGSS